MNDGVSSDGTTRKGTRRRRTWYRRRLRVQRTLVAVFFGTVLAAACWQNAAHFLPLPTLHSSQMLPDSFARRVNVHRNLALMAASARPAKVLAPIPDVYPYSVIPGGVKNLNDLRNAAEHDFVVKSHYANFDYNRARLVRVTEAREVYLSYRIRNTVFWTRRKARLHLGELLLTDGKITARAHCGNQISDTVKPEVSNEEPAADILDRPVTGSSPRTCRFVPCSLHPTCPLGSQPRPCFSPEVSSSPPRPTASPSPPGARQAKSKRRSLPCQTPPASRSRTLNDVIDGFWPGADRVAFSRNDSPRRHLTHSTSSIQTHNSRPVYCRGAPL